MMIMRLRKNYGWAAEYNINPEVLSVLLEAGADAKLEDDIGLTAFDYANENEHITGTSVYWKLNDARL